MIKKGKRFFSGFLALLMFASSIPINVFATEVNDQIIVENIENSTTDVSNLTITDSNGNKIEAEIDEIENKEELLSQIESSEITGEPIWFYDVNLKNESIDFPASISIKLDEEDKNVKIAHYSSDGIEYLDSKIEDGIVHFQLNSFSPIAIFEVLESAIQNNEKNEEPIKEENEEDINLDDVESMKEWMIKEFNASLPELQEKNQEWWDSLLPNQRELCESLMSWVTEEETDPNHYTFETLDEAIEKIENGINSEEFFKDTLFEPLNLDDLYQLRELGYTLDDLYGFMQAMINPDDSNSQLADKYIRWLDEEIELSEDEIDKLDKLCELAIKIAPQSNIALYTEGTNSTADSDFAVLSVGITYSSSIGTIWGAPHGRIFKLSLGGAPGFCGGYGKSAKSGYKYTNLQTHTGRIGYIIKKYANSSSNTFVAAQVAIWGIQRGYKDSKIAADVIGLFSLSVGEHMSRVVESILAESKGKSATYYSMEGPAGSQMVLTSAPPSTQVIPPIPGGTDITIPYIDNYYMEETAHTEYKVDITKESIITNEYLDGIKLTVVESTASGDDESYDIVKGTSSSYGSDYANATTSSFGTRMTEYDSVPYLDQPTNGDHTRYLTTDENGKASTTYIHEHTFREFYSICQSSPGVEISYEEYNSMWETALEDAKEADENGEKIEVSYMGSSQEMSYDQIKSIYETQKGVYTQTQEEAENTIYTHYDAYMARTHTYTVTEETNYTRNASTDSNGKSLDEINLPKAGYRMNIYDSTTIGPYVKVLADGETMIAGGTNDCDKLTHEKNITNEPWYNQLFINKTDLETNSQILYDTEFEIFEYYQYKVKMENSSQKIPLTSLIFQFMNKYEDVSLENIETAAIKVTAPSGNVIFENSIDASELINYENTSIEFETSESGKHKIELTVTTSGDTGERTKVIENGELKDAQTCSCETTCEADSCPICNVDDKYCKLNGTEYTMYKLYSPNDTGIYIFSDGTSYIGKDENNEYSVTITNDMYTLTYTAEETNDGTYSVSTTMTVDKDDVSTREIDKSQKADINDYTTWGQDNYEIVRVTPEIAKQMGWSDTTIGMYTVHRLSDFDSYTGTTFSSAKDETTGEAFGYYEYGTLYYTQSNLGKYAIIEKEAPSDSDRSGYLGNYSDREYSYLDETSSQKNNNGAPYATDDATSHVKMVHYLDLCDDTNQYATYMLTDGFKQYSNEYYRNYVETLNDPGHTSTEDGYDADYYKQSGLNNTIGLEEFTLTQPKYDVLNKYIDQYFIDYLAEKSGITVKKNSKKTDTYLELQEETAKILNFVGTTINNDSFDNNESKESEITYNGTYTDTAINYNSYNENAEFLNERHGFNNKDYLQVGIVNYDNGAEEKVARFYSTESDVNKEQGYAFIDERTYGFIRLTKYDLEAERYVTGDIAENYEAGTDHADSDLDGAIYSLYVDESNKFDVDYFEGAYKGRLFWAQPINTGGYRIIYDADNNVDNGFTDEGTNEYKDYPHAYITVDNKFYFDYTNDEAGYVDVEKKTTTYYGIQHPDGQYGGPKHNGFFAVLEEQQVFVDADEDGYVDTWTIQDVTLEKGAKVASATIKNGELQVDGLYLGKYYFVEEVRDSIVIHSTNNNDIETSEIKWLSFAHGYLAATDNSGNPIKYSYSFPYVGETIDGTDYQAEQVYVQKETDQYSNQEEIKGAGFQIKKLTTHGESSSSGNTTTEALEGAGFTVYLISELSLIQDGTIQPAFNEDEGNMLVYNNDLVALYDDADNFVGYQFTKNYIIENNPFTEKYGTDYHLEEVNKLIFVSGHGYYYIQDILDAYKEKYYSQDMKKWDFSEEENAIARMYENDSNNVDNINADYKFIKNSLNNGSPCEYYGLNGLVKDDGDVWIETGIKNEYQLSEIYTNHFGNLRSPELPWGAYIVIETTTPEDVFTVDPMFVTITDSSATENRAKSVSLTDTAFKASLILVKRDAQSGQNVLQKGISYRIWDYTNNKYITKFLLGPNGEFSLVSQSIFETDEEGRLNAIASLELGKYRIEELNGPEGYYNLYWDHGNPTNGETLNGVGTDSTRPTEDNMFKPYYGTVDFEVTTDRLYKSSGIVDSDNLDYIYIGETYYNEEAVGKLTILKTGEVLVGYRNTDDIEYADEYTDINDRNYKLQKASAKDRAVFEQIKDYYDLGRDDVEYRTIEEELNNIEETKVDYLAIDRNGMRIAAVYKDGEDKVTMNQGIVYTEGYYQAKEDGKTFYPKATLKDLDKYAYVDEDGNLAYVTEKIVGTITSYYDDKNQLITDTTILDKIGKIGELTTKEGEVIIDMLDSFVEIKDDDGILMIEYDLSMDVYEEAELRPTTNTYILKVSGDIVNTSYLVTKVDENYITNDYGVISKDGNKYKLTYTEAIYDPDIDYEYILTTDGETKEFRLVTYGIYMSKDGEIAKQLPTGGFEITDGENTTQYPNATIRLKNENSGTTYDFVYEERPLANATYQIIAAEDIETQDGNGNSWFKKGDIVATITTGEDGEIVSYAPNYKTNEDTGSGSYDYTYYYGNTDGTYTSLSGQKTYNADAFATTGSIENYWTDKNMSQLDKDIYGIPAYTDETIYPNTFYKESSLPITRRIYHGTQENDLITTDYITRLEEEGNITSISEGVVTETDDGYRLTYQETKTFKNATLKKNGDYYTLTLSDGNEIEVKESKTQYIVTSSNVAPWTEGDIVEKTAQGYHIEHTDACETTVSHGARTDGAKDLGYTHMKDYDSASIRDEGNGVWTLIDKNGNEILTMSDNPLVTEEGGFVEKTTSGYEVTYTRYTDITSNQYVNAYLDIEKATLIIKNETYNLNWDKLNQQFKTSLGTTVKLADDYSKVIVTTKDSTKEYSAFDLNIEYTLHYAEKQDIVTVEKDGTLGEVSIYLPLGKYEVKEIATPYGFLINNQILTVEFEYADQIKEVVFNTEDNSNTWTDETMKIWESKGLQWFTGGINTIGEKLYDIFGVDKWTWGTYGDAEKPYYGDKEGFLSYYDQRVKAWSQEKAPDVPEDTDIPGNGNITISKKDISNGEELPGAKLVITKDGKEIESWTSTETPHQTKLEDGTYELTEITAPNGYEVTETITFVVENGKVESEVVMYDAPNNDYIYISKQDITTKEELPGAKLVITNENGENIESWTSTTEAHKTKLEDGTYTLTEITSPNGYEIAETITFTVKNGTVNNSMVIMYDKPFNDGKTPNDDRREESIENQWKLGVGIYKADKDTKESLAGAKFALYTTDNIYNVDGKLLVPKDTKLAVATTDKNGFANFAVDIALMSRYLDTNRKDEDLIYEKSVSYTYEKLEKIENDTYRLILDDTDVITVNKIDDTTFETEDGTILHIDTTNKEISYLIEQSIDGNTAINTGKFYIKELTPPDGYLYDDTIYPVSFEYDNDTTMYIPVYAKHLNVETEVTITKKDLTGAEEIPGAKISVYKINDVNNVNEDGLISHEDSNLRLIDTWTSNEEEHLVKGLLLSNTEWARLNNQEVRENVYVFREEIPADGYTSAKDIEFKLYQISDENGNWMDANGELYGYKVIVNHVTCDQDYISGTIVAPIENADDWILRGETENNWNYETTLNSITVAKWLLVNKNLVVFLSKDATPETIAKVLQEKDFEQYEFDTVYFEFGGNKFDIDFYKDLVVEERPENSKITYTQVWCDLDDIHVFMYDDTTKVQISKQDIVTGEDVIGATLKITDKETGRIIDTWVTGDDGYDENGNPNQHYIENTFIVGHTYILEETLAPTQDGYVKSNSIEFTVEDTGEIQSVVMEDDFTKLEISKTDIVTEEEIEGATLEIWTADKKGNKDKLIETWVTGQDGYDENGNVNKHYIDYLPVGDYILTEKITPYEQGYVTASDINFTITETGLLQKVNMVDDITKINIEKRDRDTLVELTGATLELYNTNNELIKTWVTDGTPMHIERLPIGTYYLIEKVAPEDYNIAKPMEIKIVDTEDLQTFVLFNDRKQVKVEKSTNMETIKKGENLTYWIDNMKNFTPENLEKFTCIDTLPTNVRLMTLTTGTFNQKWTYTLEYKTNLSEEWKTWNKDLDSETSYTYEVKDLKLQENEYITQFKYYFDKVDGMFDVKERPSYTVNVIGDAGETIINDIKLTAEKDGIIYEDDDQEKTPITKTPSKKKHKSSTEEPTPTAPTAVEAVYEIGTGDANNLIGYIIFAGFAVLMLLFVKKKNKK